VKYGLSRWCHVVSDGHFSGYRLHKCWERELIYMVY
jgi:hypothetical protein